LDARHDIARELARRYGTLTTEQIQSMAELLTPVQAKKGTIVLREGEVCRHIYYVERGMVRQYYRKNGKEVTEHIGTEGGIIMCIESLFREIPSQLAVETLEPSLLYAIPYEAFSQLCQTAFAFCQIQLAILQEALIVSQHKADTLRFENAKERYLRTLQDHPDIVRRAPLHIVASYLQITPETLSRVRAIVSNEH
jgi:CRP-like cAMP-binding protein